MTKTVDFASLSLKDALDLAILIEEEAKERYQEFVDQMEIHHTPEAAGFFRAMVINEGKHEAQLSEQRRALFQDEPSRVDRSMLWDVEAPEYGEAWAFMSIRQTMQLALQSEKKAHDYFAQALNHVVNPEVRRLLEELRDEEVEHQEMIKRQMAKLPAEPDANPADYVDDPVAQ